MSWLNNSINNIKGQLTSLAQEVLAETAGPGDDEYVVNPADAKAAVEALSEYQRECELLNKICQDKDAELASLRKQITELQSKISDSGGGNGSNTAAAAVIASSSGRTSNSPTEQVTTFEDSWCWEPDNAKADNDRCSEASSGNSGEMVTIALGEAASGPKAGARRAKRLQRQQSPEHSSGWQSRVQQLEDENKQLNLALEELDNQHTQAMQNVLGQKAELQTQLSSISRDYAALKKEHAEKFINGELELTRLKKQHEVLQQELQVATVEKSELLRKNDDHAMELKSASIELADLQTLLEKKDKDNLELIERIREANKTNEELVETQSDLREKLDRLSKELEELKVVKEKKNSESSATGSSGKQSDDEFIVVREGDANSTAPSTPPSKEELKDKIVQLENRVSELTLENGSLSLKLQDIQMEKELSSNVLRDSLQEVKQKLEDQQAILVVTQEDLAEQREKNEELKEKAAEAIIADQKIKILLEEKQKIEDEVQKLKEVLTTSEELEKRLLMCEQEKERMQLELHVLRSFRDHVQESEQKLQSLTCENQQLRLSAGAETEARNSNAELEEKLRAMTVENESMRLDIEDLAQAKFSQANEEEKPVTDLDADEESDDPFNYEKFRELLSDYVRREESEGNEDAADDDDEMTTKTYKAVWEHLRQIEPMKKSMARMSEELLDLQKSKLVWEHEKKTLEADISQYILQCDELMKNNGILLNELENYKRKKLETIPENNEDNMLQLETALEECTKLNRTLEEEYSELNSKMVELEREKQELRERLLETQSSNELWKGREEDYNRKLETLELEKCNLEFELNEWKSKLEKKDEPNQLLQEAEAKCENLQQQLERLSKDHADLVNAMQAQKAALMEALKKREELENMLSKQEAIALNTKLKYSEMAAIEAGKEKELLELHKKLEEMAGELISLKAKLVESENRNSLKDQELLAKDIVVETIRTELKTLKETAERVQADYSTLKQTHDSLLQENSNLKADLDAARRELQEHKEREEEQREELTDLQASTKADLEALESDYENLQKRFEEQTSELQALQEAKTLNRSETGTLNDSVGRIAKLEADLLATADLQRTVDSLNFEKQEMIKALQQKHSENMQYYTEIQRLMPIMQNLQQQLANKEENLSELKKELEKKQDQIVFLKEKSDILTTNLLTEQTNQKMVQHEKAEVMAQNAAVRKDLERLRGHLIEIEDLHTEEMMEMQKELEETKSKMIALQEEVSKSSNAYTSASIRANQHAETLQAQYALVIQQRDELLAKLSAAEDRESKNQAALCNLQCALEQFQNDKDNDIKAATQRIRRELQQEVEQEKRLHSEIAALKQQLDDANQGLRAASRLSNQLEACQLTVAALREEVEALKTRNQSVEQQLSRSESSQSDKIDKSLIKSLLIGYVVSSNPNDKVQVLRMMSSVLEFTPTETDRVGLNKQQTSWLGALLGGGGAGGGAAGGAGGGAAATKGSVSKDNLIQAFVQFLEQESQPKANQNNMPTLLTMNAGTPTSAATAANATPPSRRTSVVSNSGSNNSGGNNSGGSNSGGNNSSGSNTHPTPIPLQPLLLHSNEFADEFVPTRSSSSILKDILSD